MLWEFQAMCWQGWSEYFKTSAVFAVVETREECIKMGKFPLTVSIYLFSFQRI